MGSTGGESGVGLKVERTKIGYVITGLKHKYPAQLQGVLKVGHLIVSVDGIDVCNTTCALPPLMLGQEGMPVLIGFIREPGGEIEHVNIVRGGGGGRSMSSMSMNESLTARKKGSFREPIIFSDRHSNLPPRPSTATATHDDSMQRDSTSDLRKRILGSASAMELRSIADAEPLRMHGDSNNMDGTMTSDNMDGTVTLTHRRSRSVALLPSAGSKKRYIPPRPNWHLDLQGDELWKAAERLPFEAVEGGARTTHLPPDTSLSSYPLSQSSTEEIVSTEFSGLDKLRDISSEMDAKLGRVTPYLPEHHENSNEPLMDSVGSRDNGGDQDKFVDISEQEKHALKVFERTPEGKMWKAERERDQQEEYNKRRSEWRGNSAIGELPSTSGKFGNAKRKDELDWIVEWAKKLPGVGAYSPPLPKREGRRDGNPATVKAGVKIGTARRFESENKTTQNTPGSGAYDPKTKTFSTIGGKFNGSSKMTAMDMTLRRVADLPGPGEYECFDREHRDVHLTRLAGKFSETVRMGRDLTQRELAKVPGAGTYSPAGTVKEPGNTRHVKGAKILEHVVEEHCFTDIAAKLRKDIPGPLDTVWDKDPRKDPSGGFVKFSQSVVPSYTDILCKETKKIPGPGAYKTKAGHKRRFTTFSQAPVETAIEQIAKMAAKVPGPGNYAEHANHIPEKFQKHVNGVNLDAAKGMTQLDWHLQESNQKPGPGKYGAPMPANMPNVHSLKYGKGTPMSDMDFKIRDAAKKPGPGQYALSGVPDAHRLPQNEKDWKAYVAYYPEMRYRET